MKALTYRSKFGTILECFHGLQELSLLTFGGRQPVAAGKREDTNRDPPAYLLAIVHFGNKIHNHRENQQCDSRQNLGNQAGHLPFQLDIFFKINCFMAGQFPPIESLCCLRKVSYFRKLIIADRR